MFSKPVLSLRGHKRAVSYVRYLNDKGVSLSVTYYYCVKMSS